MTTKFARPFLALFALFAFSNPSLAASDQPSSFQFSGFGTLGIVAVPDDGPRFKRVGIDHPGPENPDFGPDTVAGVQGSLRLNSTTNAVVQAVSRESPLGDYNPHVTLAFLSHALTPSLTARIGRMRIPFFMVSESLDINYANLWVRPPVEVYGLNPFTDLDGIDFLYRTRIGKVDLELHPYLGTSSIPLYDEGHGKLRNLAGLNIAATYGNLSVHLGHGEARLALHWGDALFNSVASALYAAGQQNVLAELSGDDGYSRFDSLGFQWDDGNWQVVGEYARRANRRYANSAHGWYFTVGHRFGAVTPFLTFARQTEDRPITRDRTSNPALDAGLDAVFVSRNPAQQSITLGARWDFATNAALKAELMHAHTGSNASGSFFAPDPSTADVRDQVVNTLSLSLDVTF